MTLTASILLLIAALVFLALLGKKGKAWKYSAKALLTENEKEFFGRLTQALPEFHIFPQVALGALLKTNVTGKDAFRARAAFSQKIADYVICDRSLNILAVVELDDRTHDSSRDAKRDAMLQQAGYRTIRWHSRRKPDRTEIRAEVLGG